MSLRNRAVLGLSLAVQRRGSYALPASANPAGTGLVISEVYGGGGNTGATYKNDFIELYNPTARGHPVDGMSVQYRTHRHHRRHRHHRADRLGAGGWPLPGPGGGGHRRHGRRCRRPDATGTHRDGAAPAARCALANTTAALTPPHGNVDGNAAIVDFVGLRPPRPSFEGAAAGAGPTNDHVAPSRNAAGTDTDNNAADFTAGAPDPENAAASPPPPPDERRPARSPRSRAPAPTSPLAGKMSPPAASSPRRYPTGGFNGFYIQTPGTGGDRRDPGRLRRGLRLPAPRPRRAVPDRRPRRGHRPGHRVQRPHRARADSRRRRHDARRPRRRR